MASYTRLYVHYAWATSGRAHLIEPSCESELHAVIGATAREVRCKVLAIGGMPHHLHVLAELPPIRTVAAVAKAMKGASSHFMNRMTGVAPAFRWQAGYGAFSVSPPDVVRVARYIDRQKTHRIGGRLSADLERCDDGEER